MGSASLKLGASFFVSVVILVLVGSWVLYTYESPAEIERCEKAEGAFDSAAILGVDLTEELQEQTKMSDLTIMTNELFEEIKRQAQDVHQPLCENNWDYASALFNTGTIIASLGFFHTAPQTFEGKLVVSFLVLFGTPLYFLSIGLIGNAIAKSQLKRIVNTGTALKIGGFTFGILVILALVTCVPAAIIQVLEEKIEFFDAWYFCVTTITTVGFGDIRLSGPAVAAWLLWIWIGHILMAGILVTLISAIIISDNKQQQMRDPEEQKLLTQTDGPAAYGGMMYHPTLVPVGTLSPPPQGYDPSDYRALSTIQVREVRKEALPNDSDPQIDLGSSRSSLDRQTTASESSSIQSLNDHEASATASSPVKKNENSTEHE